MNDPADRQENGREWMPVSSALPKPGGVLVETYSDMAGHGRDVFTIENEWSSGNHDGHEYWRYIEPPEPTVN